MYGETARSVQGTKAAPLSTKAKLTEAEVTAYGRKISDFADCCAAIGMSISFHHHLAAAIETKAKLDLFVKQATVPLSFDAGHRALADGDVLRVLDNHHKRIPHVHTTDIRRSVIDAPDRPRESFLDTVAEGTLTVPGDRPLDFEAIVNDCAR